MNGEKFEPETTVDVKITYEDPFIVENPDDLKVVHFAESGTEIIEVDNQETEVVEIEYKQDGFSVIGSVAVTNAAGWPITNEKQVVVLKSSGNYYAVGHDGTLKRVKYLNGTVSFIGEGTTTLDYISDYLWELDSRGQRTNAYLSVEGYSGSGSAAGITFINPRVESGISEGTAVQLRIRDGKIYSQTSATDLWTLSAEAGEGGKVKRTGLYADDASEVIFAPYSTFTANSSESDLYTQIDVDSLIEKWKREMTSEMTVNKTAEVYDYDNRIYRVDLEASSGYYELSPSIALEFVVDASRSMYYPAKLNDVGDYRTTDANDSREITDIRDWLRNHGDTSEIYYIITNPNSDATIFAIWYDGIWRYADASYYHTQDSTVIGMRGGMYGYVYTEDASRHPDLYQNSELGEGRHPENITVLNSRAFDGNIYTSDKKIAGQPWNRLDFLRSSVKAAAQVVYAVDPGARIGLVAFNSGVNRYGPFTKERQSDFEEAIDRIGVLGGTNHAAGLNAAVEVFNQTPQVQREHQLVCAFVTDGAPAVQGQSAAQCWTNTRTAATALKAIKNKYGTEAVLYTLGLSLEHVGDNATYLAQLASDEDKAKSAEDGEQIVDCITQIIEDVVIEAKLSGNVVDVIDPVFYPVNENGQPLSVGDTIRTRIDNERYVTGTVGKDVNGNWTVTWTDQRIDWPIIDSQTEEIITPGWHGTLYVKAKENFLGANGINTNAEGSKVTATQFIDHAGNPTDFPEAQAEHQKDFATPYVNVDELAFTGNSSEWTVYLGTEVDPLKELKELWSQIKVNEVVSKTDVNHAIAADGQMTYELSPNSTTDGRTEVNAREQFAVTEIEGMSGTLTDAQWTRLIAGNPVEIPYSAYGHNNVGTIQIELQSVVVDGEKDLSESPHITEKTGAPAEKYTLKITYIPSDAVISDYHTGSYGTGRPGNNTDNFDSTNEHKINVFAKGFQITKTDETFNKELTGAKFVIYRTAREGDDASKVTTIDGVTGNFYPAAELDLSSSATGSINPVEQLSGDEKYYLVETETPPGYIALIGAIPVTLTVTDSYTPKPGTTPQQTKPASGIYDWTQTAILKLEPDQAIKRTDADNQEDLTSVEMTTDSENAILYYRIANKPGTELPHTGGSGTLPYTLAGLALIVAAGLMYSFRIRQKGGDSLS